VKSPIFKNFAILDRRPLKPQNTIHICPVWIFGNDIRSRDLSPSNALFADCLVEAVLFLRWAFYWADGLPAI
jgi:hypothetical protein